MEHRQHFGKSRPSESSLTCVCGLTFTAKGPMSFVAATQKIHAHISSSKQRGIDVWENEGGPCPGEPATERP